MSAGQEWVVVGCDAFSFEYYPVAIFNDRQDAEADVRRRRIEAPRHQPGGLHDSFSLESMPHACRLTGLGEGDVRMLGAS